MNFLCPFHSDKNPSLNIIKNKIFCYSCSFKSNINFIKKIRIKKFDIFFNKEIIFNATKNLLFSKNYWLNYLNFRNIDYNIIKKYNLGCIDFKIKNFKINKILKNRLILPILNENFIIKGIGIKTNSNFCKYINIYKENVKKQEIIYGLNEKVNNNYSIIVEGFFDLFSLEKNGIINSVSILGSNFNFKQILYLSKTFKYIYFCLDGDYAGFNFLNKIKLLKKKKIIKNILFKNLPNNKDPDNFINKYGIKNFLKFMKL